MPITFNGSGQVIVQIVTAITRTAVTNSANNTITDVLSASITPTSSSNRIYISSSFPFSVDDVNDGFHEAAGSAILYRGTTVLTSANFLTYVASESRSQNLRGSGNFDYIDSPATTSAVTYKISISSGIPEYTITVPTGAWAGTNASCNLTLMEISGT